MKQRITLLLVLFFSITTFAQQGINYKAVVKDSNGNLVTNQTIGVKFEISLGVGQTTLYEEEHYPVTDDNGIFIVNIGEGNDLTGNFNTIDWSLDDIYNLKTEIDITGGSTFQLIGVSQFKKVPFASLASSVKDQSFKTVGNTITPINTINNFVIGSTQLDNDNTGFGTPRVFFDRSNSAFRAGHTSTDAWDAGNRGQFSFASGTNTKAKGSRSTAMGDNTQALGQASTALGNETIALGSNTLAVGDNTIASRSNATALGSYNEDDPNALLMVGNGTSNTNRNTAFSIKDNGNAIFNEETIFNGNSTFQGNTTITGNTTFTSTPLINADLEITGDILINFTSELQSPNTGFANLVPIAYGSVAPNGSINGGTGNFTVIKSASHVYTISVVGSSINLDNSTTTVSPISGFFRTHSISHASGDVRVHIFDNNFNQVANSFQFIIYKE